MAHSDESDMWGRVLSVQSHTVHGYVGNKAAVFPLQVLGFDVDPINSVQFSNHTGYKNGFTGDVLNGEQLTSLVDGLDRNGILEAYTHLATGYIGSVSFLRNVLGVYERLKAANPKLIYSCDPVLGDAGRLYVPEELVEIYQKEVIPIVSVLTPNQFELELLTGMKINDLNSAKAAFAKLHEQGVRMIVLTSCSLQESDDNVLLLLASIMDDNDASKSDLIQVTQPRIEGDYVGTGDLIAALLLAWTTREREDIESALKKACLTMHAVVSRTRKACEDGRNPNGEILLIQSRRDIENPERVGAGVIETKRL